MQKCACVFLCACVCTLYVHVLVADYWLYEMGRVLHVNAFAIVRDLRQEH